jgi:hypothetical protein
MKNELYDPLTSPDKNLFIKDLFSLSMNIDARYFLKKDFKYNAALGFSGHYNTDVFTPYMYAYVGGSGIARGDLGATLLPDYALDQNISVSQSTSVNWFEFGAIPGVAALKKHKNWQGLLLLGWGPLIQAKSYQSEPVNRSFFGFSSRTDLQVSLGYHSSKWFVQAISEFQFRRINFTQVKAQQYYYDLRIYFGYLIPIRKHPKIILKLEEKGLL